MVSLLFPLWLFSMQDLGVMTYPRSGCIVSPVAAVLLNIPRAGGFFAWIWSDDAGGCHIQAVVPGAPKQRQLIPVYTGSGLFSMALAASQPPDGSQLWCLVNPPITDYPTRLILPAAVSEIRTQVQGFPTPNFTPTPEQLLPQPEAPLWTIVSPAPQPGSTPWPSYVVSYPIWNPADSGCSGNPSLAFAPNGLGTGEARLSVQVAIVF
jgi:hypothetical protein